MYILVVSFWILALRMLFWLSVEMVVLLLHILVMSVWILVLRMLFWLSVVMVVVLLHILLVFVWILVLRMLCVGAVTLGDVTRCPLPAGGTAGLTSSRW